MRENELEKGRDAVERNDGAPAVVALCPDLVFASRVRGTGNAHGVGVRVVRSASGLEETVGEPGVRLALVDLTAAADGVDAVARAKAREPGLRVVAFGRHDDTEALRSARAAGADQVLARSAFVQRLPDLLREAGGVADKRGGW